MVIFAQTAGALRVHGDAPVDQAKKLFQGFLDDGAPVTSAQATVARNGAINVGVTIATPPRDADAITSSARPPVDPDALRAAREKLVEYAAGNFDPNPVTSPHLG